ncbi:hypothetical protein KIW84_051189 [Lathyrus oleraceus]|uniref:AB hydrolase-1 domain-containing protein n=1 Tax=Pisum sativum TaxID=3888 RepID=A0A9D4WJM7_PEA|nr:hypothetical protein KIW84_051189 [Pisum sativum]
MSQPSVSTPSKHSKEQSNPKNIGAEIDLSDVITDVVPLSIVHVHATSMRKDRTYASRKDNPSKVNTSSFPSMTARNVKTLEPSIAVKKSQSMTSMYLDPISVEPNVRISKDCHVMKNVMEDVEAYETSNRPRSITTLSKSSMIIADRDNVDKNIRVLISQVLGIDPKTNVVPDVSTSLAQPDNTTETPMDKSDVNLSTLSPEKSKDRERYEGMIGDLDDKDENSVEIKDQPTDIVNIEDLDSDDFPIGQRLAPEPNIHSTSEPVDSPSMPSSESSTLEEISPSNSSLKSTSPNASSSLSPTVSSSKSNSIYQSNNTIIPSPTENIPLRPHTVILVPKRSDNLHNMQNKAKSWFSQPRLKPRFLLTHFEPKSTKQALPRLQCKETMQAKKEKMELLRGLSLGKIDTSNISPLQQEVLIIWGEDDKIFPVQMAHELKQIISKNARIELMKEASHVPQTEKPEEFNNIIFNFLRSSS